MKVNHTKFTPVHIIGHPRSGTSILAVLLKKYLGISFGTESQFIIHYFKRLHKYGDLSEDKNLRLLIRDIAKERCFNRWQKFGFNINEDNIFRDLPEKNYRGVLESTFMQLAKHNKMERWGDKTPEYVNHLSILKKIFPDAQFIHIVRDGRDVALSIFQMEFGPKNIYKAAKTWKEYILTVQDFSKTLNNNQFLQIRYEDLLSEPSSVFSKLIAFLGIKDLDKRLITYISNNIHNDLKESNYYKWKYKLSAPKKILYESIACDILKNYRYETETDEVYSLNVLEKIYWNLDNKFKKWTMSEYWKDNLYKIKLRLRDIMYPMKKIIVPLYRKF